MITMQDYLLGLADLTGELMRMAIQAISCPTPNECYRISRFLQRIYDGYFLNMNTYFPGFCGIPKGSVWDLNKKLSTMEESVRKVEMGIGYFLSNFQLALR